MNIIKKWASMPEGTKMAIIALFKEGGIDIEHAIFSHGEIESDDGENAWVRLGQAAKITRMSTYTVRRWCEQGLIKWRKLNKARCGRILINRASLMSFIDGCDMKEA